MIIELKRAVIVRRRSGAFTTLKQGAMVNYSSERRGEHMVHRLIANTERELIEHTTVTLFADRPEWL